MNGAKRTMIGLIFGAALITRAADNEPGSGADGIIQQYLAMPHPGQDQIGDRMTRLAVLTRLSRAPDALATIRKTLPGTVDSKQREELTEIMGRFIQTKESASALIELLKDPDEGVRRWAVHGLRLMAMRMDRSGYRRISYRPEHPPRVDGLVPALISATKDPSEMVRINALYALADARDPIATQELRNRLLDTNARVRFHAACFLTEFQDASGLPELKETLRRLRKSNRQAEFPYYSDAEMLAASLERITGRSFGEIPMTPLFARDTTEAQNLQESYKVLLNRWAGWADVDGKH